MKKTKLISKISSSLIVGVIIGFGSACSSTMNVVEKSLEEGDLVPEQAIATVDILNEYDHHLPEPRNQLLDIDIAFERSNVMATGDTIHAQISISTKNPAMEATQFHVLVYNPTTLSANSRNKLQETARNVQSLANTLPKGSSLTVDVVNQITGLNNQSKSLIMHKSDFSL